MNEPTNQPTNTVGRRIRAAREALEYDLWHVCKAADIKPQTLTAWESDRRRPRDPSALLRLADLLGVSVEYLIDGRP